MRKERKHKPPEEKVCPLSRTNSYYGGNCQEELCAWWDNFAGLCAVLVIAQFGSEGSFYRQRQEQKESIAKARGG